jgi:hypothetical protein
MLPTVRAGRTKPSSLVLAQRLRMHVEHAGRVGDENQPKVDTDSSVAIDTSRINLGCE